MRRYGSSTAAKSSLGRTRRSSSSRHSAGTKLTCSPPWMVPTLWVGTPVMPSSRAGKPPASSSSNAVMSRAAALIALAPRCGLELCAAVPCTSIRARMIPLWARMMRSSVGSATTAATIRVSQADSASASAAAPRMRYSSSTTPAYITLTGGGSPERAMRSMACSIATPPALVSAGAAAEHPAVLYGRQERLYRHALGSGGIHVALEQDGPARVPPRQRGYHVGPPRKRVPPLARDPRICEEAGQVVGHAAFPVGAAG